MEWTIRSSLPVLHTLRARHEISSSPGPLQGPAVKEPDAWAGMVVSLRALSQDPPVAQSSSRGSWRVGNAGARQEDARAPNAAENHGRPGLPARCGRAARAVPPGAAGDGEA